MIAMKKFYKHIMLATLLWAGMATGAQAQFVINYQNNEGAQETATSDLLKVDKDGQSYLVNQIAINRVNYISRFVTDNTNEGKIALPEESIVKASDLTVIGGENEVKVDENGNFQTTSNNITAYNNEGKVVYRSYVTMESGNQMCSAALNAKETAVSLLMPMFTSIFQGMSDEVMNRIKTLIAELPETEVLAKAIDKSIVSNGYLNMDDISGAYDVAASEIARLSGLSQANMARRTANGPMMARMAAGNVGKKVSQDGISMMLTSIEKANVQRTNALGTVFNIDGYKGTFDVWNNNRLSYSEIVVGKKLSDGSFVYSVPADGMFILPPVRMGQFVDTNTTWDDIKSFITGKSDASKSNEGNTYTESKLSGVTLTLGTNDDAMLVMGPKTMENMRVYNIARAYMSMVVADIMGTTDAEQQDKFFNDFYVYLVNKSDFTESDPNDPSSTKTVMYYTRFLEIMANADLSAKEKVTELFDMTYRALKTYLKEDGSSYSNAQADKVLENEDFYRGVITLIGDKSMGVMGLDEGNTGILVEGLDIVQPKLNEQELYTEAVALYDQYVAAGNGKSSSIPGSSELFYKGMWMPGLLPSLDAQATGWDHDWNTQSVSTQSADVKNSYDTALGIIDCANALLVDLDYSGITTLTVLEGEARAMRDFIYMYLVENWGNVPLPGNQTAGSDIEVLDFIIADLTRAAALLNWQPRDGQYGRFTKGMALSYLGEAYLWKAYRQRAYGQDDKNCIAAARGVLKQVIDSNQYSLSSSYVSMWGLDEAWPNEAVWQFANEMNTNVTDPWSRKDWQMMQFYAACPLNGGWGSLYFSWELYFLFEQGDLRRDASLCTAAVKNLPQEYRGDGYGKNPFLGATINWDTFKYYNGEFAPAVWTLKHWRLKAANWAGSLYCPVHIYFKRYAGVLMDYAECLFRLNGGNDAEAWGIIDKIRTRAFGGQAHEDAKSYYTRMTKEGLKINLTGTPETLCLPFEGKAEPWQVALGQEKRKEFNCEWNLCADLRRLDFIQAHMDCNYPIGVGIEDNPDDWHTWRTWSFSPQRMWLPIPAK